MKPIINTTILLFCLFNFSITAQISYTANDGINPYNAHFSYGANMGYHVTWSDEQLADIAAGNPEYGVKGVGVKSLRPLLPEYYLVDNGYTSLLPAFQHYESLDIKDNTAFIGYPTPDHQDPNWYCGEQSKLFKNMHTAIWDYGANGTPVNEENHYAMYVYQMATLYKDYVKFWEIWNEPDLDHSGNAWKYPGMSGNWWENEPNPCEMAIKAPVSHYVRMLRISYEVIKYIDPDAYICTGGIGYPSFLDAVCRNTDNPVDGSVTWEYPLKGGAYFDVLSYHTYPQYDLREWNNDIQNFDYFRHSDAAADSVIHKKQTFENVMLEYGYDGNTYDEKLFIITECNIPRLPFGDFIGSEIAQTNFLIKALVKVQQADIRQFYVYNLGEHSSFDINGDDEYGYMGLYYKLEGVQPYNMQVNSAGITYKTTSDFLCGSNYDPIRTEALQLPNDVDGGAFIDENGKYIYVLWAKTTTDLNEWPTAFYSFPNWLQGSNYAKMQWNFSETQALSQVNPSWVELGGTPVFLRNSSDVLPVELLHFTATKSGSDVRLEWLTATETDNDHFIIEYSSDQENFEPIGQVAAIGNSSNAQAYSFLHEQPVQGMNYYRLKQVDITSSFTYSNIKEVRFDEIEIFTIAPNITIDKVQIELGFNPTDPVEVELYDISGRQCQSLLMELGQKSLELSLEDLYPGSYLIGLKIPGKGYFTKKLIKVNL